MRLVERFGARLLLAVAGMAMSAGSVSASDAESFAEIVRQIRSADYRGARPDLERLARVLSETKDPELAAYRHYWRGFALWRRALNGFNETPTPGDLSEDLRAGIASFQAALASKPDWIEAQIGIWGCSGPLVFLFKDDAASRTAVIEELTPVVRPLARAVSEKGADNPRALWLIAQNQLGGAGGVRPQPATSAATSRRGIEAALAEAREAHLDEPVWIPRWGGAENLMNLAYLYSHSELANRDLALAYAEGALVAAPEWHYVRDVLTPQIHALPQPSGEAAASSPTR